MKRKFKFCALVVCVFTFGCTGGDDNQKDAQLTTLTAKLASKAWSLQHVSGGISGSNDYFEKELVQWYFNNSNAVLTVENNSMDVTYSGLATGTYSYGLCRDKDDNTIFLKIDGIVFGGLSIAEDALTIDQNKRIDGTGADGFVLRLEQ